MLDFPKTLPAPTASQLTATITVRLGILLVQKLQYLRINNGSQLPHRSCTVVYVRMVQSIIITLFLTGEPRYQDAASANKVARRFVLHLTDASNRS
jgi:hypothetical protein